MSLPLAIGLLWLAAVLGDQCNYVIGRNVGPRVFGWEHSRWFNKKAFDQAHEFYERYGGVTIVVARFLPFLRTFAPFVAGVAEMTRSRFSLYNVGGGALWVGSLTLAGYLFGNIPWVKENLDKIIWARDPDPRPARHRRGVARAAEAGEGEGRPERRLRRAPRLRRRRSPSRPAGARSPHGSEVAEHACCW